MTIKKKQEGGKLIISLEGRLDTTTAPQLETVLIPVFGEVSSVNLDFKDLTYVSSAGLRVLLQGQKAARLKGAVMTLSNVSPEIMDVFDMTGFADFLTIV